MTKNNASKIRLMKIVEILRQNSDKDHPLSTKDLLNYLMDLGIECDRRTLKEDVDCLIELGYDLHVVKNGNVNHYWSDECEFKLSEIKILIDAVEAAGFIPPKTTFELVNKIVALGGLQQADDIRNNQVCFNTRKQESNFILSSVQNIEEALQQKLKVSFYYFTYSGKKEKFYHHNQSRILVDPLALIYLEDYYYLVCYDDTCEDNIKTYRIDRMEFTEKEGTSISSEALNKINNTNMAEYTKQVFKMFGGEEERVTLRFSKDIQGPVFDKFGTDIRLIEIDNMLQTSVNVQISPTFWGWYFQFAVQGKMKIIKPKRIIQEFDKFVKKIDS